VVDLVLPHPLYMGREIKGERRLNFENSGVRPLIF
jgi:hypothetical protein